MKNRVWKYGDNIDTDVIIPARYLNITDPDTLAKHCMEDLDKTFAKNVQKGDIIVAGENFGCGSSREHAAIAINNTGVVAVIAKSFARIFFRNAINIGLPIYEIPEMVDKTKNQDIIEIKNSTIKNITTGETYQIKPYPIFIQKIIDKGGLINYAKEKTK